MKKIGRKWISILLSACVALQPAIPVSAAGNSPLKKAIMQGRNQIRYAGDYEEVYKALKAVVHYYIYDDIEPLDWAEEEIMAEESYTAPASGDMMTSSVPDSGNQKESFVSSTAGSVSTPQEIPYAGVETGAASGENVQDYSDTNLRDQSVDEADIVRTDGKYIYSVQDNETLYIVEADNGKLTQISASALGEKSGLFQRKVEDFYLDGDTLLLISSDKVQEQLEESRGGYTVYTNYTSLYTYDISDRAKPVLLGSVHQEGDYMESRKKDGVVYLFSRYYPDIQETFEDSRVAPVVNGEKVPAEKMCIPNCVNNAACLIVSSVGKEEPDRMMDTDVLVSGGNSLYVSGSSIYSLNEDWKRGDRTEIIRQDYQDGEIESRYSCFVKGRVKDSFCIDEYNGYLRVLSNYYNNGSGIINNIMENVFGYYDRYTRKNALTIFDSELFEVSSIGGIARDEELKSARFSGDYAWFVTFRNTDPLFCVDLSDPEKPVILGELKVTGYSTYLHPFGAGRLAGFGYEADENWGGTTGLKVSLFDTSDPKALEELSRAGIPGISWCPAIENYKSVFAAPEKGLLGFFCENRYFLYSVTDKEITRKMLYDFYQDDLQENSYENLVRALYIGNYFYIAGKGYVISFSLGEVPEKIQVLKLS